MVYTGITPKDCAPSFIGRLPMSQLIVGPTPTQALAFTNLVFVNSHIGSDYALVDDTYLFKVSSNPAVPTGRIGFNSLQRRFASLSDGVSCTVAPFTPAPNVPFTLTSLAVELNSLIKYSGSVDAEALIADFKKAFSGFPFAPQQTYLCDHRGTKFTVTVSSISTAPLDADLVSNENEGSSARASAAPKQVPRFGILAPDTEVTVSKSPKSAFKLENVRRSGGGSVLFKADFDFASLGIGGLDDQFAKIFRRAFASRLYPSSFVKDLGMAHAKGMLLYGPPGTGKTLMARQIGKMLNCAEAKVINGPELFNKFVGQTEENIRLLFAEAEREQEEKGDDSQLHLLIFDEIDAMCRARGSSRDSTGVHDSAVNQLLSKIDGVDALNNVLIIGMTNRRDLIDEALLRPGRLELQIEVGLPDEKGRLQIFDIHTAGLRKLKRLAEDVSLEELAGLAKNYTGAEIAGLVRTATSTALDRPINHRDVQGARRTLGKVADSVMLTRADFLRALEEIKPAFGTADDVLAQHARHGIIDWGPEFSEVRKVVADVVAQSQRSMRVERLAVLLSGANGTGKSSLAVHLATATQYPFVKMISPDDLIGSGESYKVAQLRRTFDDALKSKHSVVILDDIERLIEYAHIGPRYSNVVLQALLVLCRKQPPPGHRLLIIGTTALPDVLESMELSAAFDVSVEVPSVPRFDAVMSSFGLSFVDARAARLAAAATRGVGGLPMKQMITVLDMASSITADLSADPTSPTEPQEGKPGTVSAEAIVQALRTCGIPVPSEDSE
eukprot:TRINITY_DN33262_c0_g1_i1.p1 TRINITY_DN33262_c0_g1~~TRINITY_DN33262_c0_g1_i1.p1  ORF type:complete len:783 (-),score=227.39 TRINITY_DN33262_c0_g1_i1:219-2567(-)